MSITQPQQMRAMYRGIQALGAPAINDNFMMRIDGIEDIDLSIKQAPWATITPAGEIEIPGPGGVTIFVPQKLKTGLQGAITIRETEQGTIHSVIQRINALGGRFNGTIYEGTPSRFTLAKNYVDCFMQIDPLDRDHENRSQAMYWTGTLFFHYFGDDIPGNIV